MQHQGNSHPSNGSSFIEAQQHQSQVDNSLDIDSNGDSNIPTKSAHISSSDSSDDDQIRIKFEDWGFRIDRLFEEALKFYRLKEGKAFHPSFDERNKMIALITQAKYGNYDGPRAPDVGALDLVGKRRQYEWSQLKGMSKTEAMSKFICALDDLCPMFKAHAEAVKISSGYEQNLKSKSGLSNEDGSTAFSGQGSALNPGTNPQMHNIYSSLCKQTYYQFKSYAEAQCPNDLVKQKYLISSLQEQYYQQYISQMYPELKFSLKNSSHTSNVSSNIPSSAPSSTSDESINNESTVKDDIKPVDVSSTYQKMQEALPHANVTGGLSKVTGEVATNERADNSSYTGEKTNEPLRSMGISKEFDNNNQTHIISKESNSIPADDSTITQYNNFNMTSENHLVGKLDTMTIAPNSPYDVKQTPPQDIFEPKRLHQNIDLPPIGIFESFPEPKPISYAHQKSTPKSLINPNFPPVPVDNPLKSQHDNAMPQENRSTPRQDVQSSIDTFTERNNRYTPISVTTNDNSDLSLMQHERLPQESSTFSAQRLSSQIQTVHDSQQETFRDVLPEETSLATTTNHDHQRAPELWDSASSQGAYSPVEPVISCEEPEPATIWSKRGVAEFKESLSDDKQGGVYEIKEGTLVVIQVPTYPDGKYIYWEFATDNYDIGFGVDFVYEKHLVQPLASSIYEDMDDDDLESMIENEDWPKIAHSDPELGEISSPSNGNLSNSRSDPSWQGSVNERERMIAEKRQRLANTISILPTYRRDSHEEVFAGRHKYPGEGYYLLKFDNTYSVLRSKSLYFRVCYFM